MSNFTNANSGNGTLAAAKSARAVNAIYNACKNSKRFKLVVTGLLLVLLSFVSATKSYATTLTVAGGGNATTAYQGTSVVVYTCTAVASAADNLTNFSFTTSGTGAVTTDVAGYAVFINTSNTLTGATYIASKLNTAAGAQTFTGDVTSPYFFAFTGGTTYYVFITATFRFNWIFSFFFGYCYQTNYRTFGIGFLC